MADESVIIDVTPDPQPDAATAASKDDAATDTQKPAARKSRAPLLLTLIVIIGAFGAGTYWSQEIAARLGITLPGSRNNSQIMALQSEITQLQQDLATAKKSGAIERDALESRIALLESTPTPIASGGDIDAEALAGRLEALAEQDELLSQQLDQVHADIEAGIVQVDTSALQVQVKTQASLQQNLVDRTQALETGFAQQTGQLETMSDGSLRGLEDGLVALAVSRLRQAVDGGGVYIDERKAVEELVARRDRISFEAVDALRELAVFEASGVTTIEALQLDFARITTQMPNSDGPNGAADDDAWWEQLWQSLTEGIKVRRTDEAASTGQDDAIASIRSALDRHDVATAIDGVAVLDDGSRAGLAAWTDNAQERLRANLALNVLMSSTGPAPQ
jgi:hypothetical protein